MEIKSEKKLFGTDGIRGKANVFPMSIETAMSLGKAVAKMLKVKHDHPRVVLGKDTRLSCYMFESALVAGLTSMGVDTLVLGPLPTPGVAFITRAYRANAGIVISASHNPYYDNGIKIFSSEGFKLPDSIEMDLERMILQNDFGNIPEHNLVGKNKRVVDADGRYIEFAKAAFAKRKTLRHLKIFLDCANGACYKVAPAILRELDAEVITVGCEPNGLNINDSCGSLYPSVIQKGVIEYSADVGIALDGDGDRVIMVDEKGHIVDGDTILAICAYDLKKKNKLTNNKVIATIMTNFGVVKFLKEQQIDVPICEVGDRYVIQSMLEHKAILGGEQSGHLIFLDYNTTGDGIVSALQVLRIMMETESTLSDLASCVIKSPQALLNVRVSGKQPLANLQLLQEAIVDVQHTLGENGRVLIRYSGTEYVCRVMVEGSKKHQVDSLAQVLADVVHQEIGV